MRSRTQVLVSLNARLPLNRLVFFFALALTSRVQAEPPKSVQILEDQRGVHARANDKSPRRGTVGRGASLPVYQTRNGPGCKEPWVQVGAVAWLCPDKARLSATEALTPRTKPLRFPNGLPFRYHFVGQRGSWGYRQLFSADNVAPHAEFQPGFALALKQIAHQRGGETFGLTTRGFWVPMRDLNPARVFRFRGELVAGNLRFGWVYMNSAPAYSQPGGSVKERTAYVRFERVAFDEIVERRGQRWFKVGDSRWVSDRHVRAPRPALPPPGLKKKERWLDIDRENQILVAYEGSTPVYATLVSTGKGRGKSTQRTPAGVHRIWVKLVSSDMTNLEDPGAGSYYAIESVPWVMYFKKGYGLHGTFWHRSFGKVRSHGCVNLTPLDAQWVFDWVGPRLPTGWMAVLPTPYDPGTRVVVR